MFVKLLYLNWISSIPYSYVFDHCAITCQFTSVGDGVGWYNGVSFVVMLGLFVAVIDEILVGDIVGVIDGLFDVASVEILGALVRSPVMFVHI